MASEAWSHQPHETTRAVETMSVGKLQVDRFAVL